MAYKYYLNPLSFVTEAAEYYYSSPQFPANYSIDKPLRVGILV